MQFKLNVSSVEVVKYTQANVNVHLRLLQIYYLNQSVIETNKKFEKQKR